LSFRWVFLFFGLLFKVLVGWLWLVGGCVLWLVRPVDGGLIRIRHSPQGNNPR
jgi:hypothetical protein